MNDQCVIYNVAIIYFGLTRSTKKVYQTHLQHIDTVIRNQSLTYKKFMHTWKTKDNKQKVWENTIPQEIE
jgi:hypothetical protein